MIKYITLSLLIFVFLFALAMPVLAAHEAGAEHTEVTENIPTGKTGLPLESEIPTDGDALITRIGTIGNWIFAFFLALSIIYIVIAAFQFVTGGPEGVSEARQKLIYAAIGIGIALLAAGFDNIIRAIVTNA